MSVTFELYTTHTGDKDKDVTAEYIRLKFAPPAPGSVADEMFRPATAEDRERYKAAYRAFKAGTKQPEVKPEPVAAPPEPKEEKQSFFKSHKKG